MTYTILRMPEVCAKTGLSRPTIYERLKKHNFPSPISLGDRAIGFIESEIDEWIESRIAASRGLK
jgi:prophage regulatory protein